MSIMIDQESYTYYDRHTHDQCSFIDISAKFIDIYTDVNNDRVIQDDLDQSDQLYESDT
jgi:hypothetical protein